MPFEKRRKKHSVNIGTIPTAFITTILYYHIVSIYLSIYTYVIYVYIIQYNHIIQPYCVYLSVLVAKLSVSKFTAAVCLLSNIMLIPAPGAKGKQCSRYILETL